jgi:hypothetical protein
MLPSCVVLWWSVALFSRHACETFLCNWTGVCLVFFEFMLHGGRELRAGVRGSVVHCANFIPRLKDRFSGYSSHSVWPSCMATATLGQLQKHGTVRTDMHLAAKQALKQHWPYIVLRWPASHRRHHSHPRRLHCWCGQRSMQFIKVTVL